MRSGPYQPSGTDPATVVFDVLNWERPAFDNPFELWKEDGILHLVLAKGGQLGVPQMKEVVRLIRALDSTGTAPVMLEYGAQVVVNEDARKLLRRVCRVHGHAIALYTTDLECRLQGELFKQVHRPAFPFRVFGFREEAFRWVRERVQLSEIIGRP